MKSRYDSNWSKTGWLTFKFFFISFLNSPNQKYTVNINFGTVNSISVNEHPKNVKDGL